MNKIEVVDNFLPEETCNLLVKEFTSNNFPWFLLMSTVPFNPWVNATTKDCPFLSHVLYCNNSYTSPNAPIVNYITNELKRQYPETSDYTLERAKSNLYFKESDNSIHNHHSIHSDTTDLNVDNSSLLKTVLYYLTDSDGDTFFFDGDLNVINKQSPRKNTAVIFNSDILHASSSPMKNDLRINLNLVYRKNT